jgi:hypothetical protein
MTSISGLRFIRLMRTSLSSIYLINATQKIENTAGHMVNISMSHVPEGFYSACHAEDSTAA